MIYRSLKGIVFFLYYDFNGPVMPFYLLLIAALTLLSCRNDFENPADPAVSGFSDLFLIRSVLLSEQTGEGEDNNDDGSEDPDPSPINIYLFATTNAMRGGEVIGGEATGRAGAEQRCADRAALIDVGPGDSCNPAGVRSFISMSDYAISDFPVQFGFSTDVPIYNADGSILISASWNDLINPAVDLNLTLVDAGVVGDSGYAALDFWTFSDQYGDLSNSCGDGENTGATGAGGKRDSITQSWLLNSGAVGCNIPQAQILCICIED